MRIARIMAAIGLAGLVACDTSAGVGQLNPSDIFDPANLDFGARRIGNTHELGTLLTMNIPLTISEVRFEPDQVVFRPTLKGGGSLRGVVLRANAPAEVVLQFIPREEIVYDASMIVVFSDQRTVTLTIRARGRLTGGGDLSITPSDVVFNDSEIGGDAMIPLTLDNSTEEPMVISRVVGTRSMPLTTADVFHVTRNGGGPIENVMIPAQGRTNVELHFRAKSVGVVMDALRFSVDDSDRVAAQVNVQGAGLPGGDVTCVPLTLDFGALVRGNANDRTATCNVTGGVYTVNIAEIEASSSPLFTLMTAPAPGTVLNDGDSFQISARFDAQGSPIPHTGTLRIVSGLGRTRILALDGEVLRPPVGDVAINVALSWDQPNIDLDLHMVRNQATTFDPINDVWFAHKAQRWGDSGTSTDDPVLDRDSDGLGPEEINLQTFAENRYDVYVHYYKTTNVPTTATVAFKFHGTPGGSISRTLSQCGEMWHVGQISITGGAPIFVPVDGTEDKRLRAMCQ